jgi:hypothetical protein
VTSYVPYLGAFIAGARRPLTAEFPDHPRWGGPFHSSRTEHRRVAQVRRSEVVR